MGFLNHQQYDTNPNVMHMFFSKKIPQNRPIEFSIKFDSPTGNLMNPPTIVSKEMESTNSPSWKPAKPGSHLSTHGFNQQKHLHPLKTNIFEAKNSCFGSMFLLFQPVFSGEPQRFQGVFSQHAPNWQNTLTTSEPNVD